MLYLIGWKTAVHKPLLKYKCLEEIFIVETFSRSSFSRFSIEIDPFWGKSAQHKGVVNTRLAEKRKKEQERREGKRGESEAKWVTKRPSSKRVVEIKVILSINNFWLFFQVQVEVYGWQPPINRWEGIKNRYVHCVYFKRPFCSFFHFV